MEGIMGRSMRDFHFSLLAPLSKWGSGTDDNDDEWIMFQLCTDAKSYDVFLLQSCIIK